MTRIAILTLLLVAAASASAETALIKASGYVDVEQGRLVTPAVVLVERGMTSAQALRSATIIPADLIRMDDIGRIREGMHADLIAVAANPLEDIATLESVSFVMKAGRVYKLVD